MRKVVGTLKPMTELEHWEARATEFGLLLHERQAVLAAAGMLSGAVACCIDVLERPTETAVLAVFAEACRRANAPGEMPVRG
ncbi:hypothetical protein CAL19_12590 [Bordetella genomosp. 7]|uniref:Uncharacterized protein n=1 Tax=Bordetella genomosp. 7 TaxID=1416805 RepID=A0A261QYS5_9BORD|nr:hypothetical protein CAL19_12590 [Bordetella genomosp. 7]